MAHGSIRLFDGSQSIFFFQAEDGIRDRNVTGVQTCALPISCLPIAASAIAEGKAEAAVAHLAIDGEPGPQRRSEERRVGKEWRTQWGASQSRGDQKEAKPAYI